jgi:HEAT repeat protein/cytochrome c biogenesis protein CcdA/thioredoxin-related protein
MEFKSSTTGSRIRPHKGAGARGLLVAAAIGLSAVIARGEPAAVPSVTWTENLAGALARAGNELKPVLLVFSSPNCPWCVRLKSETLVEKDVLAALEGFICVTIDTTRDEKTAREFQVNGIPLTMILSGDGRPQAVAPGFMGKDAFLAFLNDYRKGGGKRDAAPPDLEKWLKALQAREVAVAQFPDIMAGLGSKESRIRLHKALLAYTPCPRRDWVELLKHPKLSVRLGTLEILEELAGTAYGYDPWSDAESNRQALELWQGWVAGGTNETQQVFAPLTEAQITGYIRDLASGDRDRSARAVRMLEQAGPSVIPVLESWSASATGAGEDALRRVREVRYFLLLPDSLGTERSRIVHRLVFGNQDERLRSLAATAVAGERALPVLADFLADADPLIREAAVDNLITAGKSKAYKYLGDLLKTEQDGEVIHAIIRGAGNLKGPKAVELIGPFLAHQNEDLAVAALASLSRTQSATAANAVKECLKNPSWRVRAAALEAIGKLRSTAAEKEVAACLDDPDPFVRRTAVLTLTTLSAKKSTSRLTAAFLKDDQLKGPVVAALRQMEVPLPATFAPALKGKEPEVLLSVLEGLGEGGGEAWRVALPYVQHENGDVACAAIRVVARGGAKTSEVQALLAKVLREGVKERAQAVFETYLVEGDRTSSTQFSQFDTEDFEKLVEPGATGKTGTGGGAGDALTDLFSAFSGGPSATPAPAPAPAPVPAATNEGSDPASLQDLFGAFGPAEPAEAGAPAAAPAPDGMKSTKDNGGIVTAALAYLGPNRDEDLRFRAALMLMSLGNNTGLTFLAETLDSRTAEERLEIAKRAGLSRGSSTQQLIKRLLKDSSADVRTAAVALCLRDSAGDDAIKDLVDAAFEPGSVLKPSDLLKEPYQWYQAMRRAPARRKIGSSVRAVLENTGEKRFGDPHRVLALTLLEACWREGDREVVAPYLDNENPFVRRAAWYAMGKRQPVEFTEKLQTVAQDTSEWVRGVVPAVYSREGSSEWTVYFDAETASPGLSTSFSSSSTRKRLASSVVGVLSGLSRDPVLMVRSAATLCLFSNREKADLRVLSSMMESAPDNRMVSYRIASILQESPVSWLREFDVGEVLALVDAVMAQTGEEDTRLVSLRKQLVSDGSTAPADGVKVVLRKTEPQQAVPLAGAPAGTVAAEQPGVLNTNRLVVFFRNPGCRDCARVSELLAALRTEFTDITVEELNIRNPEHARVNEVLCDRFEVPEKSRLVAPAIFCGAGTLVKTDITFERLGRLLSRTEATETAWRTVSEEELVRANQTVGERYSTMGAWIVFAAGLLDGVNPCAFATIIFLLSYLQVTRRGPRQILAVGGAFVAGIFIAYFLLGLGLVEVVVRFSLLRRLGVILNWSMAAFVAGVALLSVWDGIQCLRGRMGDMVLQLPGVLKARIHDAVRRSSRNSHFVAAAFVAGLVIAVLELACTGQVYAPTILYMLNTGQGRAGAVAYLALYNLAFIVPLLVVFAGAYGGLRSERLTVWLEQRAALVKFGTAILFAALFVLFVLSTLGTGRGG